MSDTYSDKEQDLSKFDLDFLNLKYWKLVESEGSNNIHSGICLNSNCNFTTSEIEMDETSGHCEICETNTVCAWFHLVPSD